MISPGWLKVNGSEVTACRDAPCGQCGLGAVAGGLVGKPGDKHEPTDGAIRQIGGREVEAGDGREKGEIAVRRRLADGKHLIEAIELHAAKVAGKFRKAIVGVG